jgi:hypothetical protein
MVRKSSQDPPVRTYLTLRESVMQRIEAHRDHKAHVTTADALRELLMAGLEAAEKARKALEADVRTKK